MGRSRTLPDAEVFAVIRQLLLAGGDKAVAFSSVARATGLAAPTLVQRYGSRDAMVQAALINAWDDLDARTSDVAAECPMSAKGAAQFLKLLSGNGTSPIDLGLLAADVRDPALRERALAWRDKVEVGLAARLGGGAKGRAAASILFAAWQGQSLWSSAGGRGFKLKDAVKRLV
jgi:AcrR family transcriptional regulator